MIQTVEVPHNLVGAIDAKIREEHLAKQYRPVAVAVVQSIKNEILLVRSAKGGSWGFPQGGVEEGESVIAGLLRELREETGILGSATAVRGLCYANQLEIAERWRDGFTKGKSYYYFHVLCCRAPDILLYKEELDDYQWLLPADARAVIRSDDKHHEQKRIDMLTALERLPR